MHCFLMKPKFMPLWSVLGVALATAQPVPVIRAHISVQPGDVTLRLGEIARFTIGFTGSNPITFLWLKNGIPISSSDGPEWTVPVGSQIDDGSRYQCIVANSAGSDSSRIATLHISTTMLSPRILVQPDSAPVAIGDTGCIKISTRGTAPLGFTWFKNGIVIANATDSLLKLFPVTWSDNGAVIKCRVSNLVGVVESVPFGLKVVQPNGKTIVLQGDIRDTQGLVLGAEKSETMDVVTRLYREAKGGLPLYEEQFLTSFGHGIVVRNGRFTVALGQWASTGDLSQIVQASTTLYVSFAIAKPGLTPETMEPRTPFTSAPYALSAPPVQLKGDSAPMMTLEAPVGSIYQVKTTGDRYVRTITGWSRIIP